MSVSIIHTLNSQIAGQMADQVASKLGESEASTKAGIEAIIPTILAGSLNQVTTPGGASKFDNMLVDGGYDGERFENIRSTLSGAAFDSLATQGGQTISTLFGNKTSTIVPCLADETGMRSTSITSLLTILAPLVLSYLGQQKSTLGLDADGVAKLLTSQKDSIHAAVPPAVADAIGLESAGQMGATSASLGTKGTSAPAPATTGSSWLSMALVVALILAAVGYGCYLYIFAGMRPSGAAGNVVMPADDTRADITTEMTRDATPAPTAEVTPEQPAEATPNEPPTEAAAPE